MTGIRIALMAAASALIFSVVANAEETANAQAAEMRVINDQSALLRLDRPAKTVIVGNPSIADVQLIDERTIYVLGRMFGNTNIIAIDEKGGEVSNTRVTVGASDFQQVTVYRGPNGQRNLACAPQCERTVMQGNSEMQAIIQDSDKKIESGQKSAAIGSQK